MTCARACCGRGVFDPRGRCPPDASLAGHASEKVGAIAVGSDCVVWFPFIQSESTVCDPGGGSWVAVRDNGEQEGWIFNYGLDIWLR